jgi:hypothetical protein
MYEIMTDALIAVLDDLPLAGSQARRHHEVRAAAQGLDDLADACAARSTDTASTEAQAGRAVADGFRAAAQLCRLAIR